MSRIGKKIIEIPSGVNVEFNKETGEVKVKGSKGELSEKLLPFVDLKIEGNEAAVFVEKENDKNQRAMWGTSRSLIANMIEGVSTGFKKQIELNGVGFKMELSGDKLVAYIGFSHPVEVSVPQGIKLELNKNVLSGESIDKQMLGNFFTTLHNKKPCDVYKHKGFKFPDRYYPKKIGKKAGAKED